MSGASAGLRIAATRDVSEETLAAIKRLNERAHVHFSIEDWEHALGGKHFFVEEDGEVVSHACIVERKLESAGTSLRTGYVEAVATRSDLQGRGLMSRIMAAIAEHIRTEFELGGLCTGENSYFARFRWETWRGPTFVRTRQGLERTEHEDGNVMILRTVSTPQIDLDAAISCEWRPGDVW